MEKLNVDTGVSETAVVETQESFLSPETAGLKQQALEALHQNDFEKAELFIRQARLAEEKVRVAAEEKQRRERVVQEMISSFNGKIDSLASTCDRLAGYPEWEKDFVSADSPYKTAVKKAASKCLDAISGKNQFALKDAMAELQGSLKKMRNDATGISMNIGMGFISVENGLEQVRTQMSPMSQDQIPFDKLQSILEIFA